MPPKNRLLNRQNVKKKVYVVPPNIKKGIVLVLQIALAVGAIILVVSSGWKFIYKQIAESYKPNANMFQQCSNSFIKIKTKPLYGIVFKTKESFVKEVYLTAPESDTTVKSIKLNNKDWVVVYFSNNFNFTQIGEFLRLSKLEKGNYDYCYILEQLSLTSGIPVEYVIVDDEIEGISSSVSIAKTQEILLTIDQKRPLEFNHTLLPINVLDDGTKVAVTTYESFREQFPTFFKIEEISQEQAFVEVYNATDISGYASIFSRKWSMLGIDISRVGNAAHEEEGEALAILYVRNEQQYSRTLAMIKSSFPEGKVSVKIGRPSSLVTTGDIVVFLLKR